MTPSSVLIQCISGPEKMLQKVILSLCWYVLFVVHCFVISQKFPWLECCLTIIARNGDSNQVVCLNVVLYNHAFPFLSTLCKCLLFFFVRLKQGFDFFHHRFDLLIQILYCIATLGCHWSDVGARFGWNWFSFEVSRIKRNVIKSYIRGFWFMFVICSEFCFIGSVLLFFIYALAWCPRLPVPSNPWASVPELLQERN